MDASDTEAWSDIERHVKHMRTASFHKLMQLMVNHTQRPRGLTTSFRIQGIRDLMLHADAPSRQMLQADAAPASLLI